MNQSPNIPWSASHASSHAHSVRQAAHMLAAAGLSSKIRLITLDAAEYAGADPIAFLAYVKDRIAEYKTNKFAAQLPVLSEDLLLLLRTATPTQCALFADLLIDCQEMVDEGHSADEIRHYLTRNYLRHNPASLLMLQVVMRALDLLTFSSP